MKSSRIPKLNMDLVALKCNQVALDKFHRGAKKVTKIAKMRTGINKGRKSFYGSWNGFVLNKKQSVLENLSIQAGRFQSGYSTVAIQLFSKGKYVGWRTSQDPTNKVNPSLTRWCEKFVPRATEANTNGKRKTFHINVPMNKFGIKNHAVSQMISAYLPKIQKSIKSGLRAEVGNNLKKYSIKK